MRGLIRPRTVPLTATVTRRNVAGIEVPVLAALVLRVEQRFEFLLELSARPFSSAASNAFIVGP